MPRFRKRPVVIDAIQFDGHNHTAVAAWMGSYPHGGHEHPDGFAIQTLEGTMVARLGDWVLKGVKGEFYPCRSDIFEATYELVEDDSDGAEAPLSQPMDPDREVSP